jgi:hypothetical protein
MPVTLVTRPAEQDQDAAVHPWSRRLKYVRVEELLADYVAANAAIGRQHCPVADYLRAHLADDILEVEAFVYAHPEWGPPTLCESLHATLVFNNARTHPQGHAIAAWAQHYLLLHLARLHSYPRARGPFEAMLTHPRMRFAAPEAAFVALAYLNAGHPNPRRFLEKPEVAAKFAPFGVDPAAFQAPHFT